MSEAGPSSDPNRSIDVQHKVRVHKLRARPLNKEDLAVSAKRDEALDRRIAEIIPGLADLSLSQEAAASAQNTARQIRLQKLQREQQHAGELLELEHVYDFSLRFPVDDARPSTPWQQDLRPKPRRIILSPYQYEMINYQRMLMRKNIWYYRDRMSVPRGPCPLHVLKDCWVQGVIDEHTLVWGHGLYDWLPVRNVKLLTAMIRTPEVRFGAWFKRTFSLKPALERIRERRRDFRTSDLATQQIERMR